MQETLAEIGSCSEIQPGAVVGFKYRADAGAAVIGDRAVIRSGTIIYGDVEIGDDFQAGHHALIRERTRAGLVAARARGRAGGRKPKLSEAQIKEINEMVDAQKLPIGRIAELYGVSRTTIYKVAPRRENEAGEAQPVKKKP